MAIKKAYVEIVDYLRANAGEMVEDVLETVEAMASAKTGGGARAASTVKRDENGDVIAIFCYYHKMWEDPREVEFGARASAPTGLNNMCKEGTSQWTKQQREAKKASEGLLNDILSGETDAGDAQAIRDDIEDVRKQVVPREDGHGVEDDSMEVEVEESDAA